MRTVFSRHNWANTYVTSETVIAYKTRISSNKTTTQHGEGEMAQSSTPNKKLLVIYSCRGVVVEEKQFSSMKWTLQVMLHAQE